MGPFQWFATHWTPEIDYREYPADEVEDIAWEATRVGSKRGFLVGFPAGALCIGLLIAGGVMTGRSSPLAPPTGPSPGQQDATASQALRQEVTMLREENHALQQAVSAAKAVVSCPPCPPQAGGKDQPPAHAVAPPPPPAKPARPRTTVGRKPSGTVPYGQAAQPIPSDCRQAGDCP